MFYICEIARSNQNITQPPVRKTGRKCLKVEVILVNWISNLPEPIVAGKKGIIIVNCIEMPYYIENSQIPVYAMPIELFLILIIYIQENSYKMRKKTLEHVLRDKCLLFRSGISQ